ncbi:DMT family transporter [Kineosporia sp. R_H_3]|uniref:DMT family transporter n=1 Tax=Kineosporia sp. R_H_3 TaxID=1961848 RepID=UPI001304388C|nr:DMT family transporter [Kineosporia sp. R_H_3]
MTAPLISGRRLTSGRRGAWLALGGAIAVGSVAFTQIKLVLEQVSPLALAAGRVGFSAVAFALVVTLQPWRRTPVAREDRLAVLACGLGGSAGFHLLYTWGQQRVSVAVGAIVLGCMPVVVGALEVVFLRHRLTMVQVGGLVLSVAGVTLMSFDGSGEGGDGAPLVRDAAWFAGFAAVAGATVVWSAVSVTTRSLADRYDQWWLNTPGTLVGALVMALLVVGTHRWPEYGDLSASGWLQVAWLGAVGSAFLYAALARAMQHLHATTTASVSTLVTPLGVVVAWVVLGERPSWPVVAGGAVVLVGAFLVTARPTAARARA